MKKIFPPLFALLIFAGTIGAQGLAVGPQVGFLKSKDAASSTTMPGAALRIYLGGVGIEGGLYYKKEEFNTSEATATSKSYPIFLTGLFSVMSIAHLEIGVGWMNAQINYSNFSNAFQSIKDETKNSFSYHVGAGIEIPVSTFILTGDVRYVMNNFTLDNLTHPTEIKSDFVLIMIGAMFKL